MLDIVTNELSVAESRVMPIAGQFNRIDSEYINSLTGVTEESIPVRFYECHGSNLQGAFYTFDPVQCFCPC